jgi:hypothetical protein
MSTAFADHRNVKLPAESATLKLRITRMPAPIEENEDISKKTDLSSSVYIPSIESPAM